MLDSAQAELLKQLREAAADDLARVYSATWSAARLRTVLVNACREAGHRIVESPIAGTPAHQPRPAGQARRGDLLVVPRRHTRAVSVDLIAISARDTGDGAAVPTTVQRAFDRVAVGVVDAVLISADVEAYDQARSPTAGHARVTRARPRAGSALPASAALWSGQMQMVTWGDAALAAVAKGVYGFGSGRLAFTAHVVPY